MHSFPTTQLEALRSKYSTMTSAIGSILALIGVGHLLPLVVILFEPEDARFALAFIVPALIGIILGVTLIRALPVPVQRYALSLRDGAILVVAVWIMAMLMGALPFWIAKELSFLNALFESASGWSTTGLSVMNVDATPQIFLFWRSLTQFFGALGVVLIALASVIGTSAHILYQAEGRSGLLIPNIQRTVMLIVAIYLGLTVLMTLLYAAGGMSWFDALNHAMCTVSTGGFSSRGASFAYWNSPLLDILSVVLMFIASTNYATHFLLLRGEWKPAFRNREWRLAGGFLLIAIPLVFFALSGVEGYGWSLKGLRVTIFETMAALSSTGFTSTTYAKWPDLALFVLTLLMLVGGGTGSTAGGIKQYRIYLLIKSVIWDVKKRLLPRRVVIKHRVWSGSQWQEVDQEEIAVTAVFVVFYLLVYAVGVTIFLLYGYPLRDSLFEMASSISTIGLSVGITSATAPAAIRVTQIVAMFLGRLEIFVVLFGMLQLGRDARLWRSERARAGAEIASH